MQLLAEMHDLNARVFLQWKAISKQFDLVLDQVFIAAHGEARRSTGARDRGDSRRGRILCASVRSICALASQHWSSLGDSRGTSSEDCCARAWARRVKLV